jgi:NitT/TauT family transport system ATP-binding protein
MTRYMPKNILIDCIDISKSFWNKNIEYKIFENFNLRIEFGKVTCILGPSGCGKSTLLNILARIDLEHKGIVAFKEVSVSLTYLFQEDLLLPWLTSYKNALLGIKFLENQNSYIDNVDRLFNSFGLSKYKNHYPSELSGGMKQRVSLIRTLSSKPSLILFDEPFTALDFHQKLKIEKMIIDEKREKNQTLVFITHDMEQAIALGDRVIVIEGQPAKIIHDEQIKFLSDNAGRDPIKVRQDSNFANYIKSIYSAFNNEKK